MCVGRMARHEGGIQEDGRGCVASKQLLEDKGRQVKYVEPVKVSAGGCKRLAVSDESGHYWMTSVP
jgi:hypothetical protein